MEQRAYTRIRLLSAVALVLLAGICITGALLIITNPGLILLYAAAGVGLVYGGWLLLKASGFTFWWGVVLTVLALAAVLIATGLFFSQPGNARRLLVLAGLSVAYVGLAGIIGQQYWRARRAVAQDSSPQTTRPALIINPKSGDGRAVKAKLADKARTQGIDVTVLRPGQDMVQLAEAAIERGANVIGISGGDGSLGVVAQVAIKHGLPLVVLPGGTRCHFARDIGLDPARIADALAGFWGVERRVDIGLLGDRVFLNNASFGLYAEITSNQEYRERKIETSRRVTRSLASSANPFYPLVFRDGAGTVREHAALVLVGVNRYETLRLDELGERKRLDGGVLQIIALRALDNRVLKQLAARNRLGTAQKSPLMVWTAATFAIAYPSGWLRVGLDGESLRVPSPAELQIVPGALRLLVPAEGARHRPVRPISAVGAKTLWDLIFGKRPAEPPVSAEKHAGRPV
ncbi:MAG TPA: diacylglycerol kinase family protein [Candidatus Saccharimonadales bacterium]|jgi:diacylglycerol kinase family enzyme